MGERRIAIDRFLGDEEREPEITGYEIHKVYLEKAY
jgi:hypothetical protein